MASRPSELGRIKLSSIQIVDLPMRVGPIDFRRDARVIPFLSAHPDAHIYHYPYWLAGLQAETGQQCLMLGCESADGSLCGILPVAYTRGLPFNISNHQTKRRIASLPRTPFAGPITTNTEATRLLVAEAIKLAEAEDIQLQMKTNETFAGEVDKRLVATEWRPTYVLDLPDSPEGLTFGSAKNRHNLKWGVNKAKKLGLSVRSAESESDLRAWYDLYLATMRRNLVPPRSFQLFLSLWRELKQPGLIRLLLAEQTDATGSTLIAGSIFLMAGKYVFYAFTGCSTRELTTHANDLILWESIHQACRDGYRYFDFGEVAEEHPELARFKTKWGAIPKPLYRYYFPHTESAAHTESGAPAKGPSRSRQALVKLWQYVPLPITALVGKWLYGYL